MKITQDMVGLEFELIGHWEIDFDSYRVKIKFEEISKEGLEIFGVKNED